MLIHIIGQLVTVITTGIAVGTVVAVFSALAWNAIEPVVIEVRTDRLAKKVSAASARYARRMADVIILGEAAA